jgi:hypothetical protein
MMSAALSVSSVHTVRRDLGCTAKLKHVLPDGSTFAALARRLRKRYCFSSGTPISLCNDVFNRRRANMYIAEKHCEPGQWTRENMEAAISYHLLCRDRGKLWRNSVKYGKILWGSIVVAIETKNYWTLSIVRILKNQKIKTRRFGNWICFHPQVRGDTYSVGSLKKITSITGQHTTGQVSLRLTVGQSVCLGVELHLGLMTRY